MYHALVRRRIRDLFAAINRGDPEPVLRGFSRSFAHVFLGDHALGGTRVSKEATRDWYMRLFRLLPDIQFVIHRISVSGPPWNTIAFVEWSETNSGTDGVKTSASGVHVVELSFGAMKRLLILPDTTQLTRTLDRLAAIGVAEAHAPQITG